jgi:hypothetical protein
MKKMQRIIKILMMNSSAVIIIYGGIPKKTVNQVLVW